MREDTLCRRGSTHLDYHKNLKSDLDDCSSKRVTIFEHVWPFMTITAGFDFLPYS